MTSVLKVILLVILTVIFFPLSLVGWAIWYVVKDKNDKQA